MHMESRFPYFEDLPDCASFWNECLKSNYKYNKVFSPLRYRQICASTIFYLYTLDFVPRTRQAQTLLKCLQWWKEIFTYCCALTDQTYRELLGSTVGYLEEIGKTYILESKSIEYLEKYPPKQLDEHPMIE